MTDDVGPSSQPEADPDTERVVKSELDAEGGPEPEASTTILETKGSDPDVKATVESDEEGSS